MYVVHGEIYTFEFNDEKVDIKSELPNTFKIHMEAKYNEDFSVFNLAKYISALSFLLKYLYIFS